MTLFTIAYRSAPVFTTSVSAYRGEIDRILATARRRIAEVSATGAMLLYADWFVQLLEGAESDVRVTYERIALDLRHNEIQILFESETALRRFPEWSMAFVGEAAAIRKRFADSPLAKPEATVRGEEVVDFMVALASGDGW